MDYGCIIKDNFLLFKEGFPEDKIQHKKDFYSEKMIKCSLTKILGRLQKFAIS